MAGVRHEYGLRSGQKALNLFLAVLLGGMAALVLVSGAGDLDRFPAKAASAGLMAFALYLALVALRTRLIIDGTRVQVQGALRTREFDLSQVEGYRTFRDRYQSYRVICLKDGASNIRLMKYATDSSLYDWFAGLKDLDQEDRQRLLEKIDQDQELGATPEERRKALAGAKQINVATCVVDSAAAAIFLWAPAEYHLAAAVVLALAPVAAAFMLYRQPLLYGLFKAKADPRADVNLVLILSGFGLLMGASRVNFISTGLLLPFIVVAALASLAMFYPAARKNPRAASTLIGICLLSGLYGWGVAASADSAADASLPQTYAVQVLGSHISRGSRSTNYYLELEPWGPYAAVNSQMHVSAKTYYATRAGQIVCLALHPGALRVPWYEAVPCGNGTP
jgi:hypothetical protein